MNSLDERDIESKFNITYGFEHLPYNEFRG